jgi:RNA polymerase sigma-70 factor (ECF subfamily)
MNSGVVEALNEQTANADFILVKASQEGDSTAFARLVSPCHGRLLALARAITRNREDAEDVVQKSLLQAFVHLDAFQGGSRFSTWLMRIAINEALMNLRKKHRSLEVSLDECREIEEGWLSREVTDSRATPEENCSKQELYRLLVEVIEQLRPSLQAIVHLRYMKGLSAEETSRRLGVPVSTVKARLHRARLQLRKIFKQHFPRKSGVLEASSALDKYSLDGQNRGHRTLALSLVSG